MPYAVHHNPDGSYVHFCTDCGAASKYGSDKPFIKFQCLCKGRQVSHTPTATVGAPKTPRPPRINFKLPVPPCAYLGPEAGEPIKLSCNGGKFKRARDCYHPGRVQAVSKRTGLALPNRAASGWWCKDLGSIIKKGPSMYFSCENCALRTPQLYLPKPPV